MKSKILFLTLCLIVSGVAYIAADTTFSWSGGGQKGTLTYTSLGLASPTISGTVTDSATYSLASNKVYVGNDSGARTAMGIASASEVSLSQDGTNVTLTLEDDVVAPAEMADADHGDFSWSSGVGSIDADAVDADNIGTIAQSDTNATTTATEYTPAYIGQVLVGSAGTGTNAVWISKGLTTNDWVQVAP